MVVIPLTHPLALDTFMGAMLIVANSFRASDFWRLRMLAPNESSVIIRLAYFFLINSTGGVRGRYVEGYELEQQRMWFMDCLM